MNKEKMITVACVVQAETENVWEAWTKPEHITRWCFASDDWHAPYAENDLRTGGAFKTTMAAKDGSVAFDFEGIYTLVDYPAQLAYTLGDGRRVEIRFIRQGNETQIIESFEPESIHSAEMQKQGWQAILDNFKTYTEGLSPQKAESRA